MLLSKAQSAIDGTFAFQTDPNKEYSIYVPSSYSAAVPNKLMLGLHPLNTARWNAESWRDTLIAFAETNNLLMICPDGGADGAVDDDIDTAFTSAVLDSMLQWYNVDEDKIYVMGFSWGGLTTYTYGLNHHSRFGGFIPIGAVINGAGPIGGAIANADSRAFYLVHGSNDSPNSRFYPPRDSLIANGAYVNSLLMAGVGHTIDFPNRNQILTEAFEWIDSVNCANLPLDTTSTNIVQYTSSNSVKLVYAQGYLEINSDNLVRTKGSMLIFDSSGREVFKDNLTLEVGTNAQMIRLSNLEPGLYIFQFTASEIQIEEKFLVR